MSEIQENRRIKTLDDIVFESRNKDYGCYHLRATYRKRLLVSVILSFSLFLLTILCIFLFEIQPWNKKFNSGELVQMEDITYDHDMVTLLSQLNEILPEQKAPTVLSLEPSAASEEAKVQSQRKEVPVIELRSVIPDQDTSKKRLVDDLLKKHESQVKKDKTTQSDSVIMFLEKVPEFPGGVLAVQAYFHKYQHYPENALIRGIFGSTMVSFVVSANGSVERASVVKGIDPELDQEAIRLVKAMPHWQPAFYKGKPIASMLVMPVNFTIK
jgi:periplasmic protein TonB